MEARIEREGDADAKNRGRLWLRYVVSLKRARRWIVARCRGSVRRCSATNGSPTLSCRLSWLRDLGFWVAPRPPPPRPWEYSPRAEWKAEPRTSVCWFSRGTIAFPAGRGYLAPTRRQGAYAAGRRLSARSGDLKNVHGLDRSSRRLLSDPLYAIVGESIAAYTSDGTQAA